MKIAARILSLLILAGVATAYVSCKDGEEKDPEEKVLLAKLNNPWVLSSATLDGTPRTTDFPNLTLTFSGTFVNAGTYDYSFTGTRPTPSPWPVSGKWKFDTPVSSKLIRDPGTTSEQSMDYEVSASSLVISFTLPSGHTGWAGGTSRTASVGGLWRFEFTK